MIDPAWENVFNSRNWGQKPSSGVMRFMLDHFCPLPDPAPKVLDVGCGWGANMWYMAMNGFEAHGIDGSPTAIKEAEKVLRNIVADKDWRLHIGDFCQLPYADNYFDAAVDVAAISCVDFYQAQIAYDEIFRVLKPGGVLYTQCFAPGTWEGCFAEGTYNRITSGAGMMELLHKFHFGQIAEFSRRILNTPDSINEWMIVVKKPEVSVAPGNS